MVLKTEGMTGNSNRMQFILLSTVVLAVVTRISGTKTTTDHAAFSSRAAILYNSVQHTSSAHQVFTSFASWPVSQKSLKVQPHSSQFCCYKSIIWLVTKHETYTAGPTTLTQLKNLITTSKVDASLVLVSGNNIVASVSEDIPVIAASAETSVATAHDQTLAASVSMVSVSPGASVTPPSLYTKVASTTADSPTVYVSKQTMMVSTRLATQRTSTNRYNSYFGDQRNKASSDPSSFHQKTKLATTEAQITVQSAISVKHEDELNRVTRSSHPLYQHSAFSTKKLDISHTTHSIYHNRPTTSTSDILRTTSSIAAETTPILSLYPGSGSSRFRSTSSVKRLIVPTAAEPSKSFLSTSSISQKRTDSQTPPLNVTFSAVNTKQSKISKAAFITTKHSKMFSILMTRSIPKTTIVNGGMFNNSTKTKGKSNTTVQLLTYAILLSSVVVGNTLVLLTISRDKKGSAFIFVTSLTLADLFVGVVTLPVRMAEIASAPWTLTVRYCRIAHCLTWFSLSSSSSNLLSLTLDRYVAISYPLRYKSIIPKKRAVYLSIVCWAVAAFSAVLPSIGIGSRGGNGPKITPSLCAMKETFQPEFLLSYTIIFFCIPGLFIGIAQGRIYKFAKAHLKRHKTMIKSQGNTNQRKHQMHSVVRKEARLNRTFLLVVCAFYCCWIPTIVGFVLSVFSPSLITPAIIFPFSVATFLNSAVNPIIYIGHNKGMRKTTKHALRALCVGSTKHKKKSERKNARMDSENEHSVSDSDRSEFSKSAVTQTSRLSLADVAETKI